MVLRSALRGIVFGVSYGLASRLLAAPDVFNSIMSFGFLFLVPFVLGYLTVSPVEKPGMLQKALLPWIASGITLLVAWLTGLERTIFIVMGAPVFFALSSLGGLFAAAGNNHWRRILIPVLLVLPHVTSALETCFALPQAIRTVRTRIEIDAPREVIWENIKRIRRLDGVEHCRSFFQVIGLPPPFEATLSKEGVGGIRHASFERELAFIETITGWDEQERIEFNIEIDTLQTCHTAVQDHIAIGGKYFDTLTGRYWIEKTDFGSFILYLESNHRLSTRFNFYAGLWADSIMSHIQEYILTAIKTRCESFIEPPVEVRLTSGRRETALRSK